MVLRCTASALDQSEAKGKNQQKGDYALNLFRMLAGMLFQELWKHVGKNHDKHNDQDYNCRQGVDGRVDSLGHIIDHNGNILYTVSGYKVRNYEIVKGHGKRQQRTGENAILDHGHDYLGQRLERGCSKIHGCICQVRVKASHLGINTGDHIWRTKGNVRQQHGKVPFPKAQ